MRFDGTDIPERLLSALQDDHLVIFVGAGASVNPPSNLPSFQDLACRIASENGRDGCLAGEPIDGLLGRLEREDLNVRGGISRILGNPESKPNGLHDCLVRLFRQPALVRIVTTNFDRHLTTAAEQRYGAGAVHTYCAPALPLGDSFHGIVYLHGALHQPDSSLVFTDSQFSSAYLVEGWATRFLVRLFQTYDVLFVGYSHDDVIMQYLARGLPTESTAKRYLLTDRSDDPNWSYMGIKAVQYPRSPSDDTHCRLVSCMEAWSKRVEMGFLDHQRRIRSLLESEPENLTPEELDYLYSCAKEPYTLAYFTQYASSPKWVDWADHQGLLAPLFLSPLGSDPGSTAIPESVRPKWAEWFAENFVAHNGQEGLTIVQRHGNALHHVAWNTIAHSLYASERSPGDDSFGAWVIALISSFVRGRCSCDYLGLIFEGKCQHAEHIPTALAILDFMTEPYAILEPSIPFFQDADMTSKKVHVAVSFLADNIESAMSQGWIDVFKPQLQNMAENVLVMAGANLDAAHRILVASGQGNSKWDALSFHRSAIEVHEQNEYRHGLDILIDAARDALEALLHTTPDVARATAELWIRCDSLVQRRLAIHAVTLDSGISPDQKLSWLLKNRLLFASFAKHEVFMLLKNAYPSASNSAKRKMIRAARVACARRLRALREDRRRKRTAKYELYNLMLWLSRVAPNCPVAGAAFTKMSTAHHDFAPREHPDLNHSMIAPGWLDAEDSSAIQRLVSATPEEFIELVTCHGDKEGVIYDRESLLGCVRSAFSTQAYEWAWERAMLLRERDVTSIDVWGSIIDGWAKASLNDSQWTTIFDLIESSLDMKALVDPVGDVLAALAERLDSGSAKLPLTLDRAEAFAGEYWKVLHQSVSCTILTGDSVEWLTEAVNNPGGKLARFWFGSLSVRWREHRSSSSAQAFQLPGRHQGFFEEAVAGEHYQAQMSRVIIASHLHWLFAIDPDWTRNRIIPLFGLSEPAKYHPLEAFTGNAPLDPPYAHELLAQQAWHGFLVWGRWMEELLDDLLPLCERLFSGLSVAHSDQMVDLFCRLMASVAIRSARDPFADGWITKLVGQADEKSRVKFATWISRELRHLKQEECEAVWCKWLQRYWCERASGPMPKMGGKEMVQALEWSLVLGEQFPSASELACKCEAPDLVGSRFFDRFSDSGLVRRYPRETAKLMAHLLPAVSSAGLVQPELRAIYQDLDDALGLSQDAAKLMETITDELARLGCFLDSEGPCKS